MSIFIFLVFLRSRIFDSPNSHVTLCWRVVRRVRVAPENCRRGIVLTLIPANCNYACLIMARTPTRVSNFIPEWNAPDFPLSRARERDIRFRCKLVDKFNSTSIRWLTHRDSPSIFIGLMLSPHLTFDNHTANNSPFMSPALRHKFFLQRARITSC